MPTRHARPRRLTPEDVLNFPIVSDARIDPAGETIAFVRGELVRGNAKLTRQNIWISEPGGEPRQFTFGPRADASPRWLPDGAKLAFFSDRLEDGKLELFLMERSGGEARRLFEAKGEIDTARSKDALQWSPDGKQVAFTMIDPETDEQKKKKETKDDAIEFEKMPKFTRIWTYDLASGQLNAVTRGNVQTWEFQWSPNGREFALIVSDLPYEWSWYRARLARMPSSGGTPRTIFAPPKRQLALPRWSPDGKAIAFLSSIWSDRGVCQGGVFIIGANGGEPRALTAGYGGSIGWIEWLKDRRTLMAAGHDQGQGALTEIDTRSGGVKTLWREPVGIAEQAWPRFTLSASQRHIALIRHGPDEGRNVWHVERGGGGRVHWRRVTQVIPNLGEFALGKQSMINWISRDGRKMHGILIEPPLHKKGQRCPLIVNPHGGPTSMVPNGFLAIPLWGQLLAARGYALFLPNFRGSSGFGLEFAEANVGDMGGMDFQDIDSGVDALIERGIADPNRLGVGGWSYGGFMTCWTVTQTRRYKAAVMGAGISNWLSFHGNSHLHTWDVNHYDNASPYERGGVYDKFSGMNYASKVTTPTLILHGEKDRDVPDEQAYQFYRALHDHRVAVELVLYPREGHGISEKQHWLDLHRRVGGWYDKYVKGAKSKR